MSRCNRRFFHSIAAIVALAGAQVHAAIPGSERQALLDLYNSAGGSEWIHAQLWNGAAGSECGSGDDIPAWYGVTCDGSNSHVIGIYLVENNLSGNLPASITALTQLQSFNVSINSLSGSIPSLSGLSSLQSISLDTNSFSGAIPSLNGLTSLAGFDVANNNLTGSIPSLTGLANLQGFNVSGNQLSGNLPSLAGLSALQVFDAHSNNLSGAVPALSGLSALQAFYLQDNQLSGSMPALAGLSNLQYLNLHANRLTGSTPSFTGLTSLATLDMGANQLTGALPSLSGLAALNAIDVDANQLSGTVPAAPSPNSLVPGASVLCANPFSATANSNWDAATAIYPWYSACGLTAALLNLNQFGLAGAWANTNSSGQGFVFDSYPNLNGSGQGFLAAGWYTFDGSSNQTWYTVAGPVTSTAASANLGIYQATGGAFNSAQAGTNTQVGTAILSFSDCTDGSMTYHFNNGAAGTIPLTRLDPNITCATAGDNGNAATDYLLSGAWADANTSFQGFFIDVNPTISNLFAGWYTFAANGVQHWYTVQASFTPGTGTAYSRTGLPVYETTGGTFNTAVPTSIAQVGTVDLMINSCSSITLTYHFNAGLAVNAGLTGTMNLTRVVTAPAGCSL